MVSHRVSSRSGTTQVSLSRLNQQGFPRVLFSDPSDSLGTQFTQLTICLFHIIWIWFLSVFGSFERYRKELANAIKSIPGYQEITFISASQIKIDLHFIQQKSTDSTCYFFGIIFESDISKNYSL